MGEKTDALQIVDARDIAASLGLLSRLPVPVDGDRATARGAAAAWAYPIAGLVLGVLACLVGQLSLWFGLPAALAAGLVLATLVITTGAMHEDGLADAADGLWGGWDTERRLAIMKDSHIGVYGVCALILGLGLRWVALAVLIENGFLWSAILATAVLSRAAMVPLMARLPHARDTGLSHSVGRPSDTTALIAVAFGALGALLFLDLPGFLALLVALLTTLLCATIARAKIGGQTGDILGATQQCTEIALLLSLAAILT